jgi:YVTN family beta-propeller protein
MKRIGQLLNVFPRDITGVCVLALCVMGMVLSTNPVEAAPRAYVTNGNSNNVSVIDTATNTVVDTIAVVAAPIGAAMTPDGAHAYVTSTGSNIVSVIDTASNTVVDTIGVGSQPFDVAMTPDGALAYVPNEGANTVSVIDTATNTVVDTIAVGTTPQGVAITPDPQIGPPTNQEQCKNGGWQQFNVPHPFTNQGDCLQFVNTGQ